MAQSTHAIGMCDMRHTEFCRLYKHFDYFVPKNMSVSMYVRMFVIVCVGVCKCEKHKIREDDDTQALSLCSLSSVFHFGFISKFELRNLHDSHMNGICVIVCVCVLKC